LIATGFGDGFGILAFDMPVGDDLMRSRFAVRSCRIEIGYDRLHEVEISEARVTRHRIGKIDDLSYARTGQRPQERDNQQTRSHGRPSLLVRDGLTSCA